MGDVLGRLERPVGGRVDDTEENGGKAGGWGSQHRGEGWAGEAAGTGRQQAQGSVGWMRVMAECVPLVVTPCSR